MGSGLFKPKEARMRRVPFQALGRPVGMRELSVQIGKVALVGVRGDLHQLRQRPGPTSDALMRLQPILSLGADLDPDGPCIGCRLAQVQADRTTGGCSLGRYSLRTPIH